MSRTTFVNVDGRGFWALDDALGAWLAYLVEQMVSSDRVPDAWLAAIAADWRVAAAITDLGVSLTFETERQRGWISEYAHAARAAAIAVGDVAEERLRRWMILPDMAVSQGFSRTKGGIGLNRILEVADGFIALVDGRFQSDPPSGWWFLGAGNGMQVIERRADCADH
ncbi:hypothetical protein [Nocardia sp. CDC160]|uniref:hypothetical protein n=1 Tax=Nocardia sp. CDC160 TaxID=3112166 RepID=UPI002DB6E0F8|nr:hypothetical protein [Nocardia sp. CDC160]MEC3919952.1 hypothetical protein [Nocardia sp. CDC160]